MATEELTVDFGKVEGTDLPTVDNERLIGVRSKIDKIKSYKGEHGPFVVLFSAPLEKYSDGEDVKVGYEVRATRILSLCFKRDENGNETDEVAWPNKGKTADFLKEKGATNLVDLAQRPIVIQYIPNKKGEKRLTF